MFQWLDGLRESIKDLQPPVRTFATLALVCAVFALGSLSLPATDAVGGPLVWLPAAFAVLVLAFMLLAGYYSVKQTVQDVVDRIETLQVTDLVPPALHVGCRIGRRRLECGVLEVSEETSGIPTDTGSVRHWSDHATLEGRLVEGALPSQAADGLFSNRNDDLYRKLAASIAELFQAAQTKGVKIASIGIAVPGGVHPDLGTFDSAVKAVPFEAGEDISEKVAHRLLEQLGIQTLNQVLGTSDPEGIRANIHLDNDARCAARWLLVEHGPSWNDFVCVFAGSGLGSGMVFNRGLFFGNRFRAGEVGHVNLNLSSELLLDDTEGKSLRPRICSCSKHGYHFESLVGIGGLGHLAEVLDESKLRQLRQAYERDSARRGDLYQASIDHSEADGIVVLRALASVADPVPEIAAVRDNAFLDLIRNEPIKSYLTLVAKQYARLFGTGIAALGAALDIDHIALCGTIPEFLRHNKVFINGLFESTRDRPGLPGGIELEYGSMLRWGWRGAALLPRDPGYMPHRRRLGSPRTTA